MFDLPACYYLLDLIDNEIELEKISKRIDDLVERIIADLNFGAKIRFTRREFYAFRKWSYESSLCAWAYNVKPCKNGDYIIYKWEQDDDL